MNLPPYTYPIFYSIILLMIFLAIFPSIVTLIVTTISFAMLILYQAFIILKDGKPDGENNF